MPNYTVKADVDTMLRANDKAGIRSAIGVGTTDAPTFLAQTLTGQSLIGTQATSLVDLAATWNTTGTPSALKLNVTDTASNAASKLMDLQVGGASKISVRKDGRILGDGANPFIELSTANGSKIGYANSFVSCGASLLFSSNDGNMQILATDLLIARDGSGILAQRNGVLKQVFRVYNTNLSGAPEWGGFDWQTTANTLRIGTDKSGTGASQPIDFVVGGVVRMSIAATGLISTSAALIVNNTVVCGAASNFEWNGRSTLSSSADGLIKIANYLGTDFGRLQLGGTTSAFPAIKRNGTGIHIVLANDSGFAPLTTGNFTSTGTIKPERATLTTSATSVTLDISHAGTVLIVTNASPITVTLPTASSVGVGYNVMVIQGGAGAITFAAGAGNTLNSFGTLVTSAGQHAAAGIVCTASNIYNLSGNLT